MSAKIECAHYLTSILANAFTTLTSGPIPDLLAAQRIQRLVSTAEGISDGYFAQIEPFYEPITPKFMLTVQTVNDSVISGGSSVAQLRRLHCNVGCCFTGVTRPCHVAIVRRTPSNLKQKKQQ
jgi:hypothetical protein